MLEALTIKAVSVERTVDVLGLFVKSGQVVVHNLRKNMLEELSRSDYIWGWEWVDILDQDPSSDWNVCFPLRMLSDTRVLPALFIFHQDSSLCSFLSPFRSMAWSINCVSIQGCQLPKCLQHFCRQTTLHNMETDPSAKLSKQVPVLCCPIPPPTPFMSTYLSQGPLIVFVLFIWYFLWKLIPYAHCLLKKIAHQVLTKSFPFHCEPIAS